MHQFLKILLKVCIFSKHFYKTVKVTAKDLFSLNQCLGERKRLYLNYLSLSSLDHSVALSVRSLYALRQRQYYLKEQLSFGQYSKFSSSADISNYNRVSNFTQYLSSLRNFQKYNVVFVITVTALRKRSVWVSIQSAPVLLTSLTTTVCRISLSTYPHFKISRSTTQSL